MIVERKNKLAPQNRMHSIGSAINGQSPVIVERGEFFREN